MTGTGKPDGGRGFWRLVGLALAAALFLLLYPQLMDFGAEIYRLFAG